MAALGAWVLSRVRVSRGFTIPEKYYLLTGVAVSVISGILLSLLRPAAGDVNLCSNLVLGVAVAILAVFFPEPLQIGRRTAGFAMAGAMLGAAFLLTKHSQVEGSGPPLAYLYFFVNIGFLTPYYEECVVRRLLYQGAARWIGTWLSAALVSLLFALVHEGNEAFSGMFSVAMCYMASKGVSTFNRAVLHGSCNVTMASLVLAGGL